MFKSNDKVKELEAQIEELTESAKQTGRRHDRRVSELVEQIIHLEGLKCSRSENLTRSHELDEREEAIARREAAADAREEADEEVTNVKHEVAAARLNAREKDLDDRERRINARLEAVKAKEVDKEGASYKAGKADGFAEGHKAATETMDKVNQRLHEVIRTHAVGAYLPHTVKEGEKNPLTEAYSELGTKLVGQLINSNQESK